MEPTEQDRSVYADVEDERDHQRSLGYTEEHDDAHTRREFLDFIYIQLTKATNEAERLLVRARLVKVAALAVAAVESIDRKAGR